MNAPDDLRPGRRGPRQGTSVTCGAACLAVARLLRDPDLAASLDTDGEDGPTESTPVGRFGILEARVHRWTNGVRGPGGPQLPWPRFWGTSPWGARSALEHGVAEPGTRYDTVVVRFADGRGLAATHDRLLAAAGPGTPVLLYVGNTWTPRHVALIATPPGADAPLLYDPASGAVSRPSREGFVARRIGIAGWDIPWLALVPRP
ncbi:hypothetical protein [Mobilicoccus sp.]|uniref:hypothetical protein n=1 Tax=Mobilicoccus sp. TaxID=2034349 RepID=UPI0028A9314B|nr:hypothetical protein [Mobilicoccus sp.]